MSHKLNPELVKAGAEIVAPGTEWNGVVQCSGIPPVAISEDRKTGDVLSAFDPLGNDHDAHALMLALMEEGWVFRFIHGLGHCAGKGDFHAIHNNQSFPLLLLKIVSAMKELPLYV